MSEAFDKLADRLGRGRLNAYAVENHIAKDDPGWVGPLQMIPLLDALDDRIATVQAIADNIPAAMIAAGSEITRSIVADTRVEMVAGVREDVLNELTRGVNVAGDALIEHHAKLAGHLAGLSDKSTEALTAVVDATTSSTSELRDAAVAARTQVKHLKDFQIWKIGTQIAAVIALVLATAWIASTYTYDTQHSRWFAAGWTAARHHR